MKNIVNYENLRSFAYSNDKLIKGDIKGIVVDFFGLNNTSFHNDDIGNGLEYAERNIIHVIPYNNPWCWMNAQAVSYTDDIIAALCDHYSLGEDVKIVSVGGSMGGLSALVYTAYARITPIACVANCPVCDLIYHFGERPELPRTLYSALCGFDGTIDEALASRSPLHLVPSMPKIPYTVFHCERDKSVNIDAHSVKFVEAMSAEHNIRFIRVPHRSHCDLSAEAKFEYNRAIIKTFD